MKIFYTTLLVVLLASCSEATPQENTQTEEQQNIPAIEATIDDIDAAVENMDTPPVEENVPVTEEATPEVSTQDVVSEEIVEEIVEEEVAQTGKVIELSTTYNNPKIEVIMDIDMSVNENDIIESISVTSPNYGGMPEFNSGIQAVVGMSVSEASEYYVSGSSLTTPAFQKALKNR